MDSRSASRVMTSSEPSHDKLASSSPSSSLLKNLNSSAFVLRFSSSYKRSVRFGSECSRLVATLSLWRADAKLGGQQFGNADQVVGDQVEQEIGSDASDAAMLGLAHCTVLFAPAEDAFGHRPARLRDAVALVPRGSSVDGAAATLAGCGDAVVLCHMRRDVDGAQIGHMVRSVIGFVFAHRNASAELVDFGPEHRLRSAPLSGAGGERDHAGHRQPMPVLHRGVANVAELRLPPGRLAVKSAVGIGRACMRVVRALLPMKVGPAVIIAAAVLGTEALL